ncbi:MAG: hypothetical protein U5L72_19625 [Bacteroidales bacterium]|nr:hypothetical protein [Bacteroidales bacterium]
MEQEDRLDELYEQGLTSLEEEQALSKKQFPSRSQRNLWFDYIRLKRNSVPDDIEIQVWERVKAEQHKHRKILISLISTAASILIITAFAATNIWSETTKEKQENDSSL